MSLLRTNYRFTVAEYEQMIEFGILDENRPVELIRGEIVTKMPIGDRHAATVDRCNRIFNRKIGDRAIVRVQNPIRFPDSEPETDISLVQPHDDFYESAKPQPADVFLLLEVSDTSIEYDRDVKGPLYAQANIVEYWILNLNDDALEVYRQPQSNGTYADVRILRRGDQIEIAALPGVIVQVAELL
ncbi:MAG TPA: Uma2 family endonuclease [Gemmataceae bacterium]|nr:Uma2 family endonuclease [Gemmataceae bacterium]